jgi:hypothetical protein
MKKSIQNRKRRAFGPFKAPNAIGTIMSKHIKIFM